MNFLLKNKEVLVKAYFFLLNLSIILLFFRKINLINVVIIALFVNWILLMSISLRSLNRMQYISIGAFFFYFVIIVFSLLFSENKTAAIRSVSKSVYLLIIPLVIIAGPKINKKRIETIYRNYLKSAFLYSSIGFLYVMYLYWLQVTNKFSYEAYGEALGVHTAYFGMFISFGVAITLVKIYQSSRHKELLGNYSLLVFFLIVFYLLSTRTAIVSAFVVVFVISGYYWKKKHLSKIFFIFLLIVFGTVLAINGGFLKERVKNTIYESETKKSDIYVRIKHWKSAIQSYSNEGNYVFGNGSGDTQELLNKYYKLNGFFGYKLDYNVHNQFLESLISLGLIGFLTLLFLIIFGLYLAIKNKNVLFVSLILIVCICFLTESMLERQRGITFFVIMMSIFINVCTNNSLNSSYERNY